MWRRVGLALYVVVVLPLAAAWGAALGVAFWLALTVVLTGKTGL